MGRNAGRACRSRGTSGHELALDFEIDDAAIQINSRRRWLAWRQRRRDIASIPRESRALHLTPIKSHQIALPPRVEAIREKLHRRRAPCSRSGLESLQRCTPAGDHRHFFRAMAQINEQVTLE